MLSRSAISIGSSRPFKCSCGSRTRTKGRELGRAPPNGQDPSVAISAATIELYAAGLAECRVVAFMTAIRTTPSFACELLSVDAANTALRAKRVKLYPRAAHWSR